MKENKKNIFIMLLLVFNLLNAQKSSIEQSGDIIQIALPLIAFSTTFIWKDHNDGSMQFLEAIGVSLFITHGLKRLINKTRPNGGKYSFPSGHTSAAFTGAAFLERRHGWKVGIPAYLLAAYVGWTRIDAKQHDAWDILAGAGIGIVSSYLFAKEYEKRNLKLSLNKIEKDLFLTVNYQF